MPNNVTELLRIFSKEREDIGALRALNAELLAAARKQEEAETFHANCEECDGEGVPELCPECFPFFDDARCMRRAILAKSEATP